MEATDQRQISSRLKSCISTVPLGMIELKGVLLGAWFVVEQAHDTGVDRY